MRVLIYYYSNQPHKTLVRSLIKGLKKHGEACETKFILDYEPDQVKDADVVLAYNILSGPKIIQACLERNVDVVYYDKGYFSRGWDTDSADVYYRFSVNEFHPLHYFQSIPRPPDRWQELGIELKPRRTAGNDIVFAGCSAKFARVNGFDLNGYATGVVREIRSRTDRPIIYRPKKALNPPPPIPGTVYSHKRCRIGEDLANAHSLVTFSSNAAVDAILSGVPAFVLGPGIAKPVSNTDLSKINDPRFPSEKERLQWCYDAAYCQWKVNEMEDGTLWNHLKETFAHAR